MKVTLRSVRDGLGNGESFRRRLDNDEGWEYVESFGKGSYLFTHTVSGETNGGWGGVADLPISILDNGRWADDGWERTS